MAARGLIQDINERFLQCYICLDQLKEPKLLPCLHRYCRDCLVVTIPPQSTNVQCPTCRKTHKLPPGGVDGFPTDFNTKNIVEFVQSQKKVQPGRKAPRCKIHSKRYLEIFCATCNNHPICLACISDSHRGHDLQDIASLAEIERQKLTGKLADLTQYSQQIHHREEDIKNARVKLNQAVTQKKAEIKEEFTLKTERIKKEIVDGNRKLEMRKHELEEILKRKLTPHKEQLQREIKNAQDKYERISKNERQNTDKKFLNLRQKSERDKKKLRQELEDLNEGFNDLLTSLKTQQEENLKKIQKLSDDFDKTAKQFENTTTTASSTLTVTHDWSDVHKIPDLCAGIDALIRKVERHSANLEELSDVTEHDMRREESVTSIQEMQDRGWSISGITGCHNGLIAVTGPAPEGRLHITIINSGGKKVQQKLQASISSCALRFCDRLSQSTVVTVSQPNTIGVYNIQTNSCKEINLSGALTGVLECVTCVATDPVKGHIIVGDTSRNLHVLNSQLKHIKSVQLPEGIHYPYAMTVHRGNLIVCDVVGCGAYAINIKGSMCQTEQVFVKPKVGIGYCWPLSVCTDKNNFIHMLWGACISYRQRQFLVKYSQDSSQLLMTRPVDDWRVKCIATAVTGQGREKLIMTTEMTGKLITLKLK